jgi:hypothetical protein
MAINKNPVIDKKIAIGVLIVAILIFGLVVGWAILQKGKIPFEKEVVPKEETATEKQLRELERLKGEAQPLSEEETQKQLEELEKLRQ